MKIPDKLPFYLKDNNICKACHVRHIYKIIFWNGEKVCGHILATKDTPPAFDIYKLSTTRNLLYLTSKEVDNLALATAEEIKTAEQILDRWRERKLIGDI